MPRKSNPKNYDLRRLDALRQSEKNFANDLRREYEEKLATSRVFFEGETNKELVKAIDEGGVSKRHLAQRLGMSPNTLQERWKQTRDSESYLATQFEVVDYPHMEWFDRTEDDNWFRVTLPQNWTPYGMTSSYPKGTTFEGRYALYVRSGRHTFHEFRELKTISAGAASGIANDPKVLAKFQEWASVAVPDLDTADVEKATDNPPEALPHGKRATTLDDLYTD